MFLYLTPAFFVDVTETWISATRIQRLATIIAGIWVEMVVCGLAMILWTNTQPSTFVHDLSYKVILITGLAVIVMNLNPLLKLDGYYFLTELIGIPDLKERSTSFVSAWFQKGILRLPAEVPAVPQRRVRLFVAYAVASGAYSYMMLFFVVRFLTM
jgi:putative peptide zinc metalloprotease protein